MFSSPISDDSIYDDVPVRLQDFNSTELFQRGITSIKQSNKRDSDQEKQKLETYHQNSRSSITETKNLRIPDVLQKYKPKEDTNPSLEVPLRLYERRSENQVPRRFMLSSLDNLNDLRKNLLTANNNNLVNRTFQLAPTADSQANVVDDHNIDKFLKKCESISVYTNEIMSANSVSELLHSLKSVQKLFGDFFGVRIVQLWLNPKYITPSAPSLPQQGHEEYMFSERHDGIKMSTPLSTWLPVLDGLFQKDSPRTADTAATLTEDNITFWKVAIETMQCLDGDPCKVDVIHVIRLPTLPIAMPYKSTGGPLLDEDRTHSSLGTGIILVGAQTSPTQDAQLLSINTMIRQSFQRLAWAIGWRLQSLANSLIVAPTLTTRISGMVSRSIMQIDLLYNNCELELLVAKSTNEVLSIVVNSVSEITGCSKAIGIGHCIETGLIELFEVTSGSSVKRKVFAIDAEVKNASIWHELLCDMSGSPCVTRIDPQAAYDTGLLDVHCTDNFVNVMRIPLHAHDTSRAGATGPTEDVHINIKFSLFLSALQSNCAMLYHDRMMSVVKAVCRAAFAATVRIQGEAKMTALIRIQEAHKLLVGTTTMLLDTLMTSDKTPLPALPLMRMVQSHAFGQSLGCQKAVLLAFDKIDDGHDELFFLKDDMNRDRLQGRDRLESRDQSPYLEQFNPIFDKSEGSPQGSSMSGEAMAVLLKYPKGIILHPHMPLVTRLTTTTSLMDEKEAREDYDILYNMIRRCLGSNFYSSIAIPIRCQCGVFVLLLSNPLSITDNGLEYIKNIYIQNDSKYLFPCQYLDILHQYEITSSLCSAIQSVYQLSQVYTLSTQSVTLSGRLNRSNQIRERLCIQKDTLLIQRRTFKVWFHAYVSVRKRRLQRSVGAQTNLNVDLFRSHNYHEIILKLLYGLLGGTTCFLHELGGVLSFVFPSDTICVSPDELDGNTAVMTETEHQTSAKSSRVGLDRRARAFSDQNRCLKGVIYFQMNLDRGLASVGDDVLCSVVITRRAPAVFDKEEVDLFHALCSICTLAAGLSSRPNSLTNRGQSPTNSLVGNDLLSFLEQLVPVLLPTRVTGNINESAFVLQQPSSLARVLLWLQRLCEAEEVVFRVIDADGVEKQISSRDASNWPTSPSPWEMLSFLAEDISRQNTSEDYSNSEISVDIFSLGHAWKEKHIKDSHVIGNLTVFISRKEAHNFDKSFIKEHHIITQIVGYLMSVSLHLSACSTSVTKTENESCERIESFEKVINELTGDVKNEKELSRKLSMRCDIQEKAMGLMMAMKNVASYQQLVSQIEYFVNSIFKGYRAFLYLPSTLNSLDENKIQLLSSNSRNELFVSITANDNSDLETNSRNVVHPCCSLQELSVIPTFCSLDDRLQHVSRMTIPHSYGQNSAVNPLAVLLFERHDDIGHIEGNSRITSDWPGIDSFLIDILALAIDNAKRAMELSTLKIALEQSENERNKLLIYDESSKNESESLIESLRAKSKEFDELKEKSLVIEQNYETKILAHKSEVDELLTELELLQSTVAKMEAENIRAKDDLIVCTAFADGIIQMFNEFVFEARFMDDSKALRWLVNMARRCGCTAVFIVHRDKNGTLSGGFSGSNSMAAVNEALRTGFPVTLSTTKTGSSRLKVAQVGSGHILSNNNGHIDMETGGDSCTVLCIPNKLVSAWMPTAAACIQFMRPDSGTGTNRNNTFNKTDKDLLECLVALVASVLHRPTPDLISCELRELDGKFKLLGRLHDRLMTCISVVESLRKRFAHSADDLASVVGDVARSLLVPDSDEPFSVVAHYWQLRSGNPTDLTSQRMIFDSVVIFEYLRHYGFQGEVEMVTRVYSSGQSQRLRGVIWLPIHASDGQLFALLRLEKKLCTDLSHRAAPSVSGTKFRRSYATLDGSTSRSPLALVNIENSQHFQFGRDNCGWDDDDIAVWSFFVSEEDEHVLKLFCSLTAPILEKDVVMQDVTQGVIQAGKAIHCLQRNLSLVESSLIEAKVNNDLLKVAMSNSADIFEKVIRLKIDLKSLLQLLKQAVCSATRSSQCFIFFSTSSVTIGSTSNDLHNPRHPNLSVMEDSGQIHSIKFELSDIENRASLSKEFVMSSCTSDSSWSLRQVFNSTKGFRFPSHIDADETKFYIICIPMILSDGATIMITALRASDEYVDGDRLVIECFAKILGCALPEISVNGRNPSQSPVLGFGLVPGHKQSSSPVLTVQANNQEEEAQRSFIIQILSGSLDIVCNLCRLSDPVIVDELLRHAVRAIMKLTGLIASVCYVDSDSRDDEIGEERMGEVQWLYKSCEHIEHSRAFRRAIITGKLIAVQPKEHWEHNAHQSSSSNFESHLLRMDAEDDVQPGTSIFCIPMLHRRQSVCFIAIPPKESHASNTDIQHALWTCCLSYQTVLGRIINSYDSTIRLKRDARQLQLHSGCIIIDRLLASHNLKILQRAFIIMKTWISEDMVLSKLLKKGVVVTSKVRLRNLERTLADWAEMVKCITGACHGVRQGVAGLWAQCCRILMAVVSANITLRGCGLIEFQKHPPNHDDDSHRNTSVFNRGTLVELVVRELATPGKDQLLSPSVDSDLIRQENYTGVLDSQPVAEYGVNFVSVCKDIFHDRPSDDSFASPSAQQSPSPISEAYRPKRLWRLGRTDGNVEEQIWLIPIRTALNVIAILRITVVVASNDRVTPLNESHFSIDDEEDNIAIAERQVLSFAEIAAPLFASAAHIDTLARRSHDTRDAMEESLQASSQSQLNSIVHVLTRLIDVVRHPLHNSSDMGGGGGGGGGASSIIRKLENELSRALHFRVCISITSKAYFAPEIMTDNMNDNDENSLSKNDQVLCHPICAPNGDNIGILSIMMSDPILGIGDSYCYNQGTSIYDLRDLPIDQSDFINSSTDIEMVLKQILPPLSSCLAISLLCLSNEINSKRLADVSQSKLSAKQDELNAVKGALSETEMRELRLISSVEKQKSVSILTCRFLESILNLLQRYYVKEVSLSALFDDTVTLIYETLACLLEDYKSSAIVRIGVRKDSSGALFNYLPSMDERFALYWHRKAIEVGPHTDILHQMLQRDQIIRDIADKLASTCVDKAERSAVDVGTFRDMALDERGLSAERKPPIASTSIRVVTIPIQTEKMLPEGQKVVVGVIQIIHLPIVLDELNTADGIIPPHLDVELGFISDASAMVLQSISYIYSIHHENEQLREETNEIKIQIDTIHMVTEMWQQRADAWRMSCLASAAGLCASLEAVNKNNKADGSVDGTFVELWQHRLSTLSPSGVTIRIRNGNTDPAEFSTITAASNTVFLDKAHNWVADIHCSLGTVRDGGDALAEIAHELVQTLSTVIESLARIIDMRKLNDESAKQISLTDKCSSSSSPRGGVNDLDEEVVAAVSRQLSQVCFSAIQSMVECGQFEEPGQYKTDVQYIWKRLVHVTSKLCFNSLSSKFHCSVLLRSEARATAGSVKVRLISSNPPRRGGRVDLDVTDTQSMLFACFRDGLPQEGYTALDQQFSQTCLSTELLGLCESDLTQLSFKQSTTGVELFCSFIPVYARDTNKNKNINNKVIAILRVVIPVNSLGSEEQTMYLKKSLQRDFSLFMKPSLSIISEICSLMILTHASKIVNYSRDLPATDATVYDAEMNLDCMEEHICRLSRVHRRVGFESRILHDILRRDDKYTDTSSLDTSSDALERLCRRILSMMQASLICDGLAIVVAVEDDKDKFRVMYTGKGLRWYDIPSNTFDVIHVPTTPPVSATNPSSNGVYSTALQSQSQSQSLSLVESCLAAAQPLFVIDVLADVRYQPQLDGVCAKNSSYLAVPLPSVRGHGLSRPSPLYSGALVVTRDKAIHELGGDDVLVCEMISYFWSLCLRVCMDFDDLCLG